MSLRRCRCDDGCGLVIATPTGCCLRCQKLINGPIRMKFSIWITGKRVSVIEHVGVVLSQEVNLAIKSKL